MKETVGPVSTCGGNYFEGDGRNRPYAEFYDFYSVSPEYFGYIIVCCTSLICSSNHHHLMQAVNGVQDTAVFGIFIWLSTFNHYILGKWTS
jgi:hypothetical protein